jgi:hypothetical protein
MPPLSSNVDPIAPGGWVNNCMLIAEAPFFITSSNMLPNGIMAANTQAMEKILTILSINLRL